MAILMIANRCWKTAWRRIFVPAFFWLAWIRYQRCKSREVCREIRPLLEYAAKRGHPEAEITLARLMVHGKFGLRAIATGIGLLLRSALRLNRVPEGAEEQAHRAVEGPRPL
jgi:hypothetical protein